MRNVPRNIINELNSHIYNNDVESNHVISLTKIISYN